MNRYSFLSLPIREELTKRITSVCKSFGLEDLYYDSFTRRYGMNEWMNEWIWDVRTELSAADVVYAINALLEECEGENGLVNDHVRMNEEWYE